MVRKKIVSLIVVGALSIVAVAGLLTYRSVYAQTTGTDTAAPIQPDVNKGPGREPGGMKGAVSDAELATALGIDLSKLQEAQATARVEALEQAVSDGLITQKQADAYSSGDSRSAVPGGMRWLTENGIDYDALLAKALGISSDELQAAQQKAKDARIASAVAGGSITQEQADLMAGQKALFANEEFQASMQSAYETAVQQAVKDNVITQAQADLILDEGNLFSGRGDFSGRGGRHGGWDGEAPDAPQTETTN